VCQILGRWPGTGAHQQSREPPGSSCCVSLLADGFWPTTLLLSILIQRPKHPSIDIDVFLEPLIQEMKTLWNEGIDITNGITWQAFNLRAIISVTIHDYHALFMMGCMVCVDDTISSFLEGSRKVVYLGYKRFLVEGHRYRSKKFYNFFDAKHELHSTPVKWDRHYVFEMDHPGHC
jgi:hypothetical protein